MKMPTRTFYRRPVAAEFNLLRRFFKKQFANRSTASHCANEGRSAYEIGKKLLESGEHVLPYCRGVQLNAPRAAFSLNRYTLSQIPWLIHIRAAIHRDMVRQELHGNREQNRHQQMVSWRNLDDFPRNLLQLL
jgi:hypothetical protein